MSASGPAAAADQPPDAPPTHEPPVAPGHHPALEPAPADRNDGPGRGALQGPSSVEPGALAPGPAAAEPGHASPLPSDAPADPDPTDAFGFATPNHHGPLTGAALALIRGYKLAASPLLPPACRFVPTCSEYGYEAVARYGIIRGGRLALWRIARCNPFGRGGADPVP